MWDYVTGVPAARQGRAHAGFQGHSIQAVTTRCTVLGHPDAMYWGIVWCHRSPAVGAMVSVTSWHSMAVAVVFPAPPIPMPSKLYCGLCARMCAACRHVWRMLLSRQPTAALPALGHYMRIVRPAAAGSANRARWSGNRATRLPSSSACPACFCAHARGVPTSVGPARAEACGKEMCRMQYTADTCVMLLT